VYKRQDVVRIAWAGNSDVAEQFQITCPFIPDLCEYQMVITDTTSANAYYMESDLFPSGNVLVAMHGNTYNQVLTVSGNSRSSYQGWYKARVYKVIDQTAENGMQAVLLAKFTRYAD
jgi:hypothetical protein